VVAPQLDYSIFMAEAGNIGYKRSKRGEKAMPNELFRVDGIQAEIAKQDGIKAQIAGLRKKIDSVIESALT
jgi:type I restriction enzyme M protein